MSEKPFDPSDPFDACCETIRRAMVDAALSVIGTTLYRELSPTEQLQAMIIGTTVATVGVNFACVMPQAKGDVVKAITDFIPHAVELADQIIANGGAS
jgi:hypothetical protein